MARDGWAESGRGGGLTAAGGDFFQLVVDYAKQETLGPLKSLGRFLVFGVAGSLALTAGAVLLLLAGLRALQTETGSTFTGQPELVALPDHGGGRHRRGGAGGMADHQGTGGRRAPATGPCKGRTLTMATTARRSPATTWRRSSARCRGTSRRRSRRCGPR